MHLTYGAPSGTTGLAQAVGISFGLQTNPAIGWRRRGRGIVLFGSRLRFPAVGKNIFFQFRKKLYICSLNSRRIRTLRGGVYV